MKNEKREEQKPDTFFPVDYFDKVAKIKREEQPEATGECMHSIFLQTSDSLFCKECGKSPKEILYESKPEEPRCNCFMGNPDIVGAAANCPVHHPKT